MRFSHALRQNITCLWQLRSMPNSSFVPVYSSNTKQGWKVSGCSNPRVHYIELMPPQPFSRTNTVHQLVSTDLTLNITRKGAVYSWNKGKPSLSTEDRWQIGPSRGSEYSKLYTWWKPLCTVNLLPTNYSGVYERRARVMKERVLCSWNHPAKYYFPDGQFRCRGEQQVAVRVSCY